MFSHHRSLSVHEPELDEPDIKRKWAVLYSVLFESLLDGSMFILGSYCVIQQNVLKLQKGEKTNEFWYKSQV